MGRLANMRANASGVYLLQILAVACKGYRLGCRQPTTSREAHTAVAIIVFCNDVLKYMPYFLVHGGSLQREGVKLSQASSCKYHPQQHARHLS